MCNGWILLGLWFLAFCWHNPFYSLALIVYSIVWIYRRLAYGSVQSEIDKKQQDDEKLYQASQEIRVLSPRDRKKAFRTVCNVYYQDPQQLCKNIKEYLALFLRGDLAYLDESGQGEDKKTELLNTVKDIKDEMDTCDGIPENIKRIFDIYNHYGDILGCNAM